MSIYPVNEIFVTMQGEASFTGTPSTFIRLQGCPVGCGWCDTKHTWHAAEMEHRVRIPVMLNKQEDSPLFASMSVDDILSTLSLLGAPRHVVITGGEPCLHDLRPLSAALYSYGGHSVQVETSGHFRPQVSPRTFITCSPKMGMPGGDAKIEFVEMANEVKWPVGKERDVEQLRAMLSQLRPKLDRSVWLQPLSQSKKATTLCIAAATEYNWRVSVQTHKFLGVR